MSPRGAVFDGSRNDVVTPRIELERGIYRGIIRLRPATGENNLSRFTPEERGDALTRQINRPANLRAKGIAARGIAVVLGQKGQHLLEHSGIELRRGVVIEINDLLARDHGSVQFMLSGPAR